MRRLTLTWTAGIVAALTLAAVTVVAQDLGEPPPLSLAKPDPAVRERILAFEAGTARAAEMPFSFRGPGNRPVYLFNAPCCDRFNKLYDAEGRYICAPTGGFTGQGSGDCPAWVHADVRWRELRMPRAHEKQQPQPPREAS